ncbi:30S ribosomal protein S16 [bacterium]|nr:30S ribosomal protein S16 [bacterium]
MLVIRFSRVGKKNRAQFRIVAQERTAAPSGKHIEILGSYDPHFKKGVFKKERIEYWIKNGAQISDSVYNVLVKQGVIKGKKRFVKITPKKEKGKKEGDKKTEEIKPEDKEEVKEEKKEEVKKKPEEKKAEEKVEESAKKENAEVKKEKIKDAKLAKKAEEKKKG